ncbi:Nicotinate phosphoribosyltransferase pncB2 [Aquicella siphonis]|uniref:Nicotinate phosphoribosyltransferase n=1 Tax=Aquicella siphonis TaxID=254247 RepID=A0A5E4PIS8_9COXI|nr:nicotinate phosphoribosyltransferase [Aquicella siphonis]VVC76854.1 Nicotinate phosphoribosyltransferase pncB2 [Aquicella siphonis]
MTALTHSPLLTDFYQLTMAYGYWKLNMHEQEAAFHLLFRKNPFKGNYALSCGLATVVDFLTNWRFCNDDLAYLGTLKNAFQEPLFTPDFLDYLAQLSFTCDVDAVPEGTVVFANEPLIRVQGPILQCQMIETALLNMINFQTLIATKASRVCRAAQGDNVIEFGMRRAQGPDGALSASRAAYIGGCVATSNTLAGKLYDIPVRGTHAHSWVTAFPTEMDAFHAYTDIMPHNTVLLVDTFNTVEGVKNAIKAGKKLRENGADLLGIRLDSGDLADLSIKARKLLDEAGFENTGIMASNSLDEYVISDLKQQNAQITSWGVGTHLATAYDQPALDGVYKLSALRDKKGAWNYKLKLSEQEVKISNPGRHQIRRFFSADRYVMDVIYDLSLGMADTPEVVLLDQSMQDIRLDDYDGFVDLLEPVLRNGQPVLAQKSIHTLRKHAVDAVQQFHNSHGDAPYSVSLEKKLFELKENLIQEIRE